MDQHLWFWLGQATCDFANDGHVGTEMGVKIADFWKDVTSQEMRMLSQQKWQRFKAIHPIFNP